MKFKNYSILDRNICLSPYTWKNSDISGQVWVEATMPGAYVKFMFTGSSTAGIQIDSTGNVGCEAVSLPAVEFSVDNGPYQIVPLQKTGEVYTLPLAKDLAAADLHCVEFFFRAADLCQERWTSPRGHLRLAGVTLDDGGVLQPVASLPNIAIGFGDSITEGVGVDKLFTSWQILDASNARASWFPMVCAALECEYGQIGTGGQGMVNPSMAVPPLPESWHLYDAKTSRLTGNLLLPEPDYIFCAMGTNDFKNGDINQPEDITSAYIKWLTAARAACPKSRIFCIVPPFGWHRQEILTAVTTRNQAGDGLVHFIDTASVKDGYSTASKPSKFAYDGVHPSVYGNAILAVHIISEVQKILCK